MSANLGPERPALSDSPVYNVLWADLGKPVSLTILNEGWVARMAHWDAGDATRKPRHRICVGPGCCCYDSHPMRRKWLAYLGVWAHGLMRPAVIVLGLTIADHLSRVRQKRGSIRGVRCELRRLGDSPYGPSGIVETDSPSLRPLPEALDLRWTLRALYGPAGWLLEGENASDFAWRGAGA